MRIFIASLILLATVVTRSAVPTFQSFEPTQFDTNGLRIKYISDWTNEVTVIHPATANTGVVTTNFTDYGTFALPAKVTLLSLGTNQLDMSLQSTWLLNSPTNDASQVILSLSAGREQGQIAVISSQNGGEGFTLPNASEQYDVPGAFVYLQGIDWIGTTNRGIILQYTAPDWVEMARFGSTGGPIFTNTPGGGGSSPFTNIAGVVQYSPGQTATNTLSIISGAADNATNVAALIGSASAWSAPNTRSLSVHNGGTNVLIVSPTGGITSGRNGIEALGALAENGETLLAWNDVTKGDPNVFEIYIGAGDDVGNGSAFVVNGTTNMFDMYGLVKSNIRFEAWPSAISTGSAIAYTLHTDNVLTNGDHIVSIGNAGIERVAIQHDGSVSLSGRTNRLGDDGSRYTRNGSPLITFVYPVAVTDQSTSISVGTNKVVFRSPFAFTLTGVRASLRTTQASGSTFTVYFSESGTSVLSTPVTIDNGSKTSVGAGTPAVISDNSIADDAELSVSVSNVGDGTAVGLLFEFYGYQ